MNYFIPQKLKIECVYDGAPCICVNSIIDKDYITEISVLDSASRKSISSFSIDEKIVLCAVKKDDIIEVHKKSEKANETYYFRVKEIGKHYITVIPDGGVIEI